MVGAAQGGCAWREAGGVPANSCRSGRAWPIRRDAGLGPIAWGGGAPDQRAGCRRDRARHNRTRAPANGGLIVPAAAAPADKERILDEANSALEKAVTDQGLSVEEYNSILEVAQNDPGVRAKIRQRMGAPTE